MRGCSPSLLREMLPMSVLFRAHIQRTRDANISSTPSSTISSTPLDTFNVPHNECSNERATALILNKYKTHSHAAHCIIVKQIVPDWASHMSVMPSQHGIHLPSPTQLATLFFAFSHPPPYFAGEPAVTLAQSSDLQLRQPPRGASAIYRF